MTIDYLENEILGTRADVNNVIGRVSALEYSSATISEEIKEYCDTIVSEKACWANVWELQLKIDHLEKMVANYTKLINDYLPYIPEDIQIEDVL